VGKVFPCLQPPQADSCAVFRHPFERGRLKLPPQRPLCIVAARALRRSLLDPSFRAYASRARLQGRRPPLPVFGCVGLTWPTIRVAADFTPSSQLVAAPCGAAYLPLVAGLALASLSPPLSRAVTLAAGQRVRHDRLCRLGWPARCWPVFCL